jgi:hypothetical protein
MQTLYLQVPKEEVEVVNNLGALWNSVYNRWYITYEMDYTPFIDWMSPEVLALCKQYSKSQ